MVIFKIHRKILLYPFNSLCPLNICDYMYLKSFCVIYVYPIVDSYHLLNLNVFFSKFIVYCNKCTCTSVLFPFLSEYFSILVLSILSPPTCPPPPLPKLVFRVSGQSRLDDILQALDVRLICSLCCIVITVLRTLYGKGKDREKPH